MTVYWLTVLATHTQWQVDASATADSLYYIDTLTGYWWHVKGGHPTCDRLTDF